MVSRCEAAAWHSRGPTTTDRSKSTGWHQGLGPGGIAPRTIVEREAQIGAVLKWAQCRAVCAVPIGSGSDRIGREPRRQNFNLIRSLFRALNTQSDAYPRVVGPSLGMTLSSALPQSGESEPGDADDGALMSARRASHHVCGRHTSGGTRPLPRRWHLDQDCSHKTSPTESDSSSEVVSWPVPDGPPRLRPGCKATSPAPQWSRAFSMTVFDLKRHFTRPLGTASCHRR